MGFAIAPKRLFFSSGSTVRVGSIPIPRSTSNPQSEFQRCESGLRSVTSVYPATLIHANAQCDGQCVKSLVLGPQLTSLNRRSREQVGIYITNATTV
jgi:hypothetical protein